MTDNLPAVHQPKDIESARAQRVVSSAQIIETLADVLLSKKEELEKMSVPALLAELRKLVSASAERGPGVVIQQAVGGQYNAPKKYRGLRGHAEARKNAWRNANRTVQRISKRQR